MVKRKTLAEQIAELEAPTPHDIDSEEPELPPSDSEGNNSSDASLRHNGREHYEPTGKSKLRSKEDISLGPQYAGSKVSRKQLEQMSDEGESLDSDDQELSDESDDENSTAGLDDTEDIIMDEAEDEDEEIDSDEAFGEEDFERFKNFTFRGSGKPFVAQNGTGEDFDSEEEEDEISQLDFGDEEEEDYPDASDGSGSPSALSRSSASLTDNLSDAQSDDEASDTDSPPQRAKEAAQRSELRRLMTTSEANIASSLSEALTADIAKGRAINNQRQAFNSLLNVRIRLQKSLIAVNALPTPASTDPDSQVSEVTSTAEKDLLSIWTSLDDLRLSLTPSSTKNPLKRKRSFTPDHSTPDFKLWEHMQSQEEPLLLARDTTLDKWSSRLRVVSTTNNPTTRLGAPASAPERLSSHLRTSLAVRRVAAQTTRPKVQNGAVSASSLDADEDMAENSGFTTTNGANGHTFHTNSAAPYDDTDFYQQLLREVIKQHSSTASKSSLTADVALVDGGALAAQKRAKTRRITDWRLSKGRRMVYTVHEKLQNFMAPEDRTTWEAKQRGELFGSLFGRKMERVLREEGGDEEDSEEEFRTEGLRLFAGNGPT